MSEEYPGQNYFHENNENIKRAELAACGTVEPELKSLREIKAKLDRTLQYVESCYQILGRLEPKCNALAESQGKLLAAMNEITDWAKGTNAVIAAKLYRKPRKKGKR